MPEQECCSSSKAKLGSPPCLDADGAVEALHCNKTSTAFFLHADIMDAASKAHRIVNMTTY